jgi:polyisoprenoid-binding protein YceI
MSLPDEVRILRLRRLGLAAAFGIIISTGAAERTAHSGASDALVGFEASGPAGLKITGSTPELTETEDAGNITISVALAKLTTGINLRDQHMREKYLEVPTFPVTTLTVARGSLILPTDGHKTEGDVQGTLVLHGQTRPITVHYDITSQGGALLSHGRFRIDMNAFGITVPTYLGVTVKPNVDVSASFRLSRS